MYFNDPAYVETDLNSVLWEFSNRVIDRHQTEELIHKKVLPFRQIQLQTFFHKGGDARGFRPRSSNLCPVCKGLGAKYEYKITSKVCDICHGDGIFKVPCGCTKETPWKKLCLRCNNRRYLPTERKCGACYGNGKYQYLLFQEAVICKKCFPLPGTGRRDPALKMPVLTKEMAERIRERFSLR